MLDVRDIDTYRDRAAFAGLAVDRTNPAPVLTWDITGRPPVLPPGDSLLCELLGLIGRHMRSPAAHHRHGVVPIEGAWLQVCGANRCVHLAVARVAHDEAVIGVPQGETFGKALDSVEQTAPLSVEPFVSPAF